VKILVLIIFVLLSIAPGFSQCEEPRIENAGEVIESKIFDVKKQSSGESFLSLEASAEDASWERKDFESAVVTIFVDEKYHQDLILFRGAEKFAYKVLLGNLSAGKHSLKLVFNRSRSAKNIRKVKIYRAQIESVQINLSTEKTAISHAPILYLRPDTIDKFSDIPLITYYEILPSQGDSYKIRYTTIFTNEDGGTQTNALMARWGRATDIEWVYEIEVKNGAITGQIIQGRNHVTKNFAGKTVFGVHPLIFDVTNNNNFDDEGCSQLRTALLPVRADLSKRSRETVMDENPWTYLMMAREAAREGRIDPKNLGVNVIDDLRNYLYVEIASQNNSTGVAVEVRTIDGKVSRSDFADARLRIERSGYQRIAVRNPSNNSPLQSVSLLCEQSPQNKNLGKCENARVVKFLKLDKNYILRETKNPDAEFHSVEAGGKLTWAIR
jgi:hypothetical protein